MEVAKLTISMVEATDPRNRGSAHPSKAPGQDADRRQSVAADGQNVPASGKSEPAQPVSRETLDAAVSRLSDFVQSVQRSLNFSVDDATGRTVVTVVDAKTDRVIRQIPSDELLNLLGHIAESTDEGLQESLGLFVQEEA